MLGEEGEDEEGDREDESLGEDEEEAAAAVPAEMPMMAGGTLVY